MRLSDVISRLESFGDDDTIYAARVNNAWKPISPAIVLHEAGHGALPPEARDQGMVYFLEIYIAREVIEVWRRQNRTCSSPDDQFLAVVYYARYDAYMPPVKVPLEPVID